MSRPSSLLARGPRPPSRLRKRLLVVGPVPPEWGGRLRGGVTRFNVTLLDELRRHPWRHRVEPVGVLIPPPQRIFRRLARRRAPLPIIMQPRSGRARRFTRLTLEREHPDVVLLNNLAAFNGARYARLHSELAPEIPLLSVVHEWRAVRAKEGRQRQEYLESAQAALDASAAVVFPSHHTLNEGSRDLGLRYPDRAEVISNPLQPAFAQPEIDVAGAEREGVAFVASFNQRKNPEGLVRAIAALPDMRLTMQGRGPEKERIEALIGELGIAERVRLPPFTGYRGHVEQVAEVMRSAELLCLPSFSESFALVIVEALAMGTPVAGFGPTLVEIRDRLGIEIGEPIYDPTPERIEAAIEAVRTRRWDRERLRRAALAEFGAPVIAGRYARLLRRLAREGR